MTTTTEATGTLTLADMEALSTDSQIRVNSDLWTKQSDGRFNREDGVSLQPSMFRGACEAGTVTLVSGTLSTDSEATTESEEKTVEAAPPMTNAERLRVSEPMIRGDVYRQPSGDSMLFYVLAKDVSASYGAGYWDVIRLTINSEGAMADTRMVARQQWTNIHNGSSVPEQWHRLTEDERKHNGFDMLLAVYDLGNSKVEVLGGSIARSLRGLTSDQAYPFAIHLADAGVTVAQHTTTVTVTVQVPVDARAASRARNIVESQDGWVRHTVEFNINKRGPEGCLCGYVTVADIQPLLGTQQTYVTHTTRCAN